MEDRPRKRVLISVIEVITLIEVSQGGQGE